MDSPLVELGGNKINYRHSQTCKRKLEVNGVSLNSIKIHDETL